MENDFEVQEAGEAEHLGREKRSLLHRVM